MVSPIGFSKFSFFATLHPLPFVVFASSGEGLEIEPTLAGRVCQCLYASVIFAMSSVEGDKVDPGCFGAGRNRLADGRGGVPVSAVADVFLQVGIQCAGRGQGRALRVVDQLGVNVFVAAENRQPRPLGRAADRLAHAPSAALSQASYCSFVNHFSFSAIVLLYNDRAMS
jgi:hypothetical protein